MTTTTPTETEGAPVETTSVIRRGHTYATVTDKISDLVLTRPFTPGWLAAVGLTGTLVCMLMLAVTYLFGKGVGVWGINVPVAWGFAIVNFVWWIGIGHAGTFISAML
ncbi:MAG TPA: hypothetical protein VLJ39_16955, partial [Tepidisphaeraceae bacterium]|nr:hypothetical protein [Tepidisphaeraceae bacterium]